MQIQKISGIALFLFLAVTNLHALIQRSPEELMEAFFRAWALNNTTYIKVLAAKKTGGLSAFGNTITQSKVLDYSIEWQEKIREYTILKTKIKLKSAEYGLRKFTLYFFLRKYDGSWVWEEGIAFNGFEPSARQALYLYKYYFPG